MTRDFLNGNEFSSNLQCPCCIRNVYTRILQKVVQNPFEVASSAVGVLAENVNRLTFSAGLLCTASGASSSTTWTLVPPTPKEFMPARKIPLQHFLFSTGSVGFFHNKRSIFKLILGFGSS